MSRSVRIATCQPLAPVDGRAQAEIELSALDLLAQAGEMGADIACLPECLNTVALALGEVAPILDASAERLLDETSAICSKHGMYAVLPLIHRREGVLRNSAFIIGRGGEMCGVYHKVHLTRPELDDAGLNPGDEYPVFDLDFGRIGITICYDVCFPEPARILALSGAEIIFCPSLQRGYTQTHLELQVRSRAYDNFVHFVRSSYGTEPGDVWQPGVMVGKSCICGPDGTILADLGRFTGVVMREIDLDAAELGYRTFGGETGVLRDMRLADRRPDTYGRLCE